MSKRNKKRSVPTADLLKRIERELGKGNAKVALRDAKVAYRAEPVPDARRLLELAYAGRVEQLHRQNMLDEALAVLKELLEFSPTDTRVCQRLPRLRIIVGDTSIDPATVFEDQPELLRELTDLAVIDWDAMPPQYNGIAEQVALIRQALTAIETGDDDRANELLRDVPRTSLLSDWKLFARGLSAFYTRDDDRAKANWERLDLARPAYRIARTLQAAAGHLNTQEAAEVATPAKRLMAQINQGSVVAQLSELNGPWRSGDWRTFFKGVRQFRQRHGKSHESTIARLTELAWRRAVREQDYELLEQCKRVLPAPELDPNWLRVQALIAVVDDDCCEEDVEKAWLAYVGDIQKLACLTEQERTVAEGLIYLRLGCDFMIFAKNCEESPGYRWDENNFDGELRKVAARHLNKCIALCPQLVDAYHTLAKLHEKEEEVDKAAKVYQQLLTQESDDLDANAWLGRYFLNKEKLDKAKPYVSTYQRLKPRGPMSEWLTWSLQSATVRGLVKKKKLDEARAELEKLNAIRTEAVEQYSMDLLAAGIEFKAKNNEAGRAFVEQAVARLVEPTPVWLEMSYVSARYALPREIKKDFDSRFKEAIKKPPTSSTAGLLALFFAKIAGNEINYPGRATQEKLTASYLKRATSVQWRESDLCHVCEMMLKLPQKPRIFDSLLDYAADKFPDSPRLSYCAGAAELANGPFRCDIEYALECFRKAIAPNEHSFLPIGPDQFGNAEQAISQLEEAMEHSPYSSFGFAGDDNEDDFFYDGTEDLDPSEFGGFPPGLDLDSLLAGLPPQATRQIEQMAAESGLSVPELIMKAVALGAGMPGLR